MYNKQPKQRCKIRNTAEQTPLSPVGETCVVLCSSPTAQGYTNMALSQHPHCTHSYTASESLDTSENIKTATSVVRFTVIEVYPKLPTTSIFWLRTTPRGSLAPRLQHLEFGRRANVALKKHTTASKLFGKQQRLGLMAKRLKTLLTRRCSVFY